MDRERIKRLTMEWRELHHAAESAGLNELRKRLSELFGKQNELNMALAGELSRTDESLQWLHRQLQDALEAIRVLEIARASDGEQSEGEQ